MALNNQHIAVLSWTEPYVTLFDRSGKKLTQWGSRGQGPGDLSYVQDIALINDQIWILNNIPTKINIYLEDGTLQRTISLGDYQWAPSLEISKNGAVAEAGAWQAPKNNLLSVGNTLKKLGTITNKVKLKLKPESGPTLRVDAPFPDCDRWTVLDSGQLVTYRSGTRSLTLNNPNEVWQLETRTWPVPEQAAKFWLRKIFPGLNIEDYSANGWVKEAKKVAMPTSFPPVLRMLSWRDHLWIHRAYTAKNQIWECFYKREKLQTLTLSADLHIHLFNDGFILATDLAHSDQILGAYMIQSR